MKKARSTTLDEQLKIVAECLANDKNYMINEYFASVENVI